MTNAKATKVTLFNNFHDTEVNVMARFNGTTAQLTKSQTHRVRRSLCGNPDCSCGTIRGFQGGLEVTEVFEDLRYGSSTVYQVEDHRDDSYGF